MGWEARFDPYVFYLRLSGPHFVRRCLEFRSGIHMLLVLGALLVFRLAFPAALLAQAHQQQV